MQAIISCFIWAGIVLATVCFTMGMAATRLLFGWCDRRARLQHWLGCWWGHTIIAMNPYWQVTVMGRRHIQPGRPYVLVSNHQSLADIIVLFCLHRQFKWLAKESLFRVPVFGWAMSLARYIRLERGAHGSIRRSYAQALDCLRRGMSVLVFPEGTRSQTGDLGVFKNGAFKLAIDADLPVIPIVINGTRDAIPKGSWLFTHRVEGTLTILPPLYPADYQRDVDLLRNRVRDLIQSELAPTPQPLVESVR